MCEKGIKQKSWNTMKVWWAPLLCRGRLHVEVFDSEFPGKCLKGQRNFSRRFVWQ